MLAMILLACTLTINPQGSDSISLREVEVTASTLPNHVSSTTPVQTIDKHQMDLLGIVNVADAVKRMAGAEVRDYGGIGGMKTVSLRHLGAYHTAISYDGVPVSNTQAGQIDIGRYTFDNVAKLSLVIGNGLDIMQSASLYASAGVLGIKTEIPSLKNKPWTVRAGMQGGSFGMLSPSFNYWRKVSQQTIIGFNGAYMRADGDYPFTLVNDRESTKEYRYNSDIYSWRSELNIIHTNANGNEWRTKAGYYYSERGLPGAVILYNNHSDERLWDENFFVQSSYKRQMSAQWQLRTQLKYEYYRNRYIDTDVKYDGGRQVDNDYQNAYYASSTLGWSPFNQLTFALAQDLSINTLRNNISNAYGETANPLRFTSLTALTARYRGQRISVDGNLLATYSTEHVHLSLKPEDRKRLSPSIAFSYRLLNNESLYARMMLKSTYRMPTFNDLYYIRLGNTGLRPERALESNLGVTYSLTTSLFRMQMTVDGYLNAVRDKIVAFPSTYVWRMANFGKVHIAGLDATLSTIIPITSDYELSMNAAYTLQQAIDKTDPSSYSYNMQLPYTPKHSGSYAMILKTPWVNFGYHANICGERYSMVQNTYEYRLHPYWEHTVTASKQFSVKDTRFNLTASLINLTNTQYEIIQFYPMPGRSWRLSIAVEL